MPETMRSADATRGACVLLSMRERTRRELERGRHGGRISPDAVRARGAERFMSGIRTRQPLENQAFAAAPPTRVAWGKGTAYAP